MTVPDGRIREVALHEISVVQSPAYAEALIGGLRSVTTQVVTGPSIDDYERQLWLLKEHRR